MACELRKQAASLSMTHFNDTGKLSLRDPIILKFTRAFQVMVLGFKILLL